MSASAPEKDKRKGRKRFARSLPVRFGTENKMLGGTVIDISEGGMRVECPQPFPSNAVLTVFVQFPRHVVRLRARVIWCGAAGESGPATMGLSLTAPDPTLKQAYADWLGEVKQSVVEAAPRAAAQQATPQAAAPPPAPPRPAAPRGPEPQGPVRRRLESRQGQAYDALLERQPDGWNLTIVQLPRQLGVGTPDFQKTCGDYASAEDQLREFVRTH